MSRPWVGKNVIAMGWEMITEGTNVITTGSNAITTTTAQPTHKKSAQLDCNITFCVIACCQLSTYSPTWHNEQEKWDPVIMKIGCNENSMIRLMIIRITYPDTDHIWIADVKKVFPSKDFEPHHGANTNDISTLYLLHSVPQISSDPT